MEALSLVQATALELTRSGVNAESPGFAASVRAVVTAAASLRASSRESGEDPNSIFHAFVQEWNALSLKTSKRADTQLDHALLIAMATIAEETQQLAAIFVKNVIAPLFNGTISNLAPELTSTGFALLCTLVISDKNSDDGVVASSFTEFFTACENRLSREARQKDISGSNSLHSISEQPELYAKSSWQNWSIALIRVCESILSLTDSKDRYGQLSEALRIRILPHLRKCATSESEHIRKAALRVFAYPNVREIFRDHDQTEMLWKDAQELWLEGSQSKRFLAYDILNHTFDLFSRAYYEPIAWEIILSGLEDNGSKSSLIRKISLNLMQLASQGVFADEKKWGCTAEEIALSKSTSNNKVNICNDSSKGKKKNAKSSRIEKHSEGYMRRRVWARRIEQFRALYEVLDEFAHHLIDSMWPEIESLYKIPASSTDRQRDTPSECTGRENVYWPPPSSIPNFRWTALILEKAFNHSNPAVRMALVRRFLEFEFAPGVHFPVDPGFICQSLLPALDFPMFYRRHVESIQKSMLKFLKRQLSIVSLSSEENSSARVAQQASFLRKFLQGVTSTKNPYALASQLQLFVNLNEQPHEEERIVKDCCFASEELVHLYTITTKNIDMNMSWDLVADGIVDALAMCVPVPLPSEPSPQSASATSGRSSLKLVGMILSEIQPTMLKIGDSRQRKLSAWMTNDKNVDVGSIDQESRSVWLFSQLAEQLRLILSNPSCATSILSGAEFSRLFWCLSSHKMRSSILEPLVGHLSKMYSSAYLAKETCDAALNLFVSIIQFIFDSVARGPKTNSMQLSQKEESGMSTSDRMLVEMASVFGPCASSICAYTEMSVSTELSSPSSDSFSHQSHNVLPTSVAALRTAFRLYLHTDFSIVEDPILKTSCMKHEGATAPQVVLCMRNIDALLDVVIRARRNMLSATDDESQMFGRISLERVLHDVAACDSRSLKRRANSTTDGAKSSLLVSMLMIHRWRSIGWSLQAMAKRGNFLIQGLSVSLIEGLFEAAHDAIDCAGAAFLESLLLVLGVLLPRYLCDVKGIFISASSETEEISCGQQVESVMTPILEHAWAALEDIGQRNSGTTQLYDAFMRLAFNEILFSFRSLREIIILPETNQEKIPLMLHTLKNILRHRNHSDPILLQRFLVIIFQCWKNHPQGYAVALPFVQPLVNEFLLYHEPEAKYLHDAERVHYGPPPNDLVRILVLTYLDTIVQENSLGTQSGRSSSMRQSSPAYSARIFVDKVVEYLISLNFTSEWKDDYMPTSEVHRHKLRGWQALVALVDAAACTNSSTVCMIIRDTSKVIMQNNHATIRYYVELFMARLVMHQFKFSLSIAGSSGTTEEVKSKETEGLSLFESCVLTPLSQLEASTKSIASLLVVLLHSLEGVRCIEREAIRMRICERVVTTVLPLLCASGSQLRILSQLIMHRIFPKEEIGGKLGVSSEFQSSMRDVLQPILCYLRDQSDMIRMRKKQEALFVHENLAVKCSLAGLLATPLNSFGEFYDEPLLDRIKETCIEYQKEVERLFPERFYYRLLKNGKLGSKAQKGGSAYSDTTKLVDAAPDDQGPEFNFQRKIQPWDTLDVLTRDLGRDRDDAISERKKQNLIVVASLIDKVPNLGGLARTCEIFGADTLIVPTKAVCNNKLFKQVSVTADKWVNIDECPPDALYEKLGDLQSKGFSLVGVEQTAQSVSLETYTFPDKTVLLLGREKTGIPSKFIHMLDACVEIPQLGIIRSLNVHVSGALMVWEYTRQQILKKQ